MRKLLSIGLALVLLAGMVPAGALAAAEKPVLYNAIITMNYPKSTTTVYAAMNRLSKRLDSYRAGKRLQVTAVYPGWVEIKVGSGLGYVLRNRVDQVVPIDTVNTPPYGVEVYTYTAEITQEMNWEDDSVLYSFRVPAGGEQELSVRVRLNLDGSYDILSWSTAYAGEWETNDTIEIWDGDF